MVNKKRVWNVLFYFLSNKHKVNSFRNGKIEQN